MGKPTAGPTAETVARRLVCRAEWHFARCRTCFRNDDADRGEQHLQRFYAYRDAARMVRALARAGATNTRKG